MQPGSGSCGVASVQGMASYLCGPLVLPPPDPWLPRLKDLKVWAPTRASHSGLSHHTHIRIQAHSGIYTNTYTPYTTQTHRERNLLATTIFTHIYKQSCPLLQCSIYLGSLMRVALLNCYFGIRSMCFCYSTCIAPWEGHCPINKIFIHHCGFLSSCSLTSL